MSENNLIAKALTPRNTTNCSHIVTNFTKQLNTGHSYINNNITNNNKSFSSFFNAEECKNSYIIQDSNKIRCLYTKKINLEENKNNYYSTAMKNIFYNPENYLDTFYKGKKIVVGKYHRINKEIFENKDNSVISKKKNKKMQTVIIKDGLKISNNSFIRKKTMMKSKSLSTSRLIDFEKFNSTESSRSFRPMGEQRKFSVSDNELKLIFKEMAARARQNKKKPMDFSLNQTQKIGIGHMMNLQEKILKTENKTIKTNQSMINKIEKITSKDKSNILMDQKKDFIVLKKKILAKELTRYTIFNKNLTDNTKTWIYNLRKTKHYSQKNFFSPIEKEVIYYNKDLFTIDINNNDNCKNNFRKKLFKKIPKFNFNIENNKKLIERNNETNLNSFHNLFIQGKNLLNQEVKLSKDLIGKKKKLCLYTFNPDEISAIMLAQSNPIDTVTTPKAVINTIENHNLK